MQVWNGKLYWGMFAAAYTVPGIAVRMGYTDFTTPEAIAFILGTLRQTTFWRVDENDNVELLYGESELPVWDKMSVFDQYGRPAGEDSWTMTPTGFEPLFGRAGFGEPFTAYTWTLQEYHGDLYCGTMNMENLIGAVADNGNEVAGSFYKALMMLCGIDERDYGFELVRWQDPDVEPQYITKNGFGNGTAYGIRNFTIQGDDLYVGSASPLNLTTNGGCHLFKVNDGKKGDGPATAVQKIEKKAAGVYVKRNGDLITIATVGGEILYSAGIYDLSGKLISSARAGSNVVTLKATNAPVVIKATSSKGTWTGKIK